MRCNLAVLYFVCLICSALPASRSHAADDLSGPVELSAYERRPYDMRLFVSFHRDSFDQSAVTSVVHEIEQSARRYAGDLWSLEVQELDWLRPADKRGLKRMTRADLMTHDSAKRPDVWFVATVGKSGPGSHVCVRSWEPEVQVETSLVAADVLDPREIPITILRLCRDLMRPIGIVEQVHDQSVTIRLRAGELRPPDASFEQLQNGDIFLPLLAYRGKDKAVERLQSIPWTYVRVDEIDASAISGTVQSGLRLALGGKKRGRIDTLMVVCRPQSGSTRLELSTQTKPLRPLVAHRIEVRSDALISRSPDDVSTLLEELVTDRRGLTKVTVDVDRSLVWLFAYSGQHLLARVPFVPGLVDQVRLEVPDDTTRLTAEADLQMLQGEVIDGVALRNTAFATSRAAAKRDDWAAVNQKLVLLARQESASNLADRLIAVRVAGTSAAKANRDKAAEVRINRMCDETAALIGAHLSDDKVAVLKEEMESLQSAMKAAEKE